MRANYPLVNFLRACMGLDPIPFTQRRTDRYLQGERLLDALGRPRRRRRWKEQLR